MVPKVFLIRVEAGSQLDIQLELPVVDFTELNTQISSEVYEIPESVQIDPYYETLNTVNQELSKLMKVIDSASGVFNAIYVHVFQSVVTMFA